MKKKKKESKRAVVVDEAEQALIAEFHRLTAIQHALDEERRKLEAEMLESGARVTATGRVLSLVTGGAL